MYYIGSHWGTEDDGYICSSYRMKNAYKRRPETFAPRKILARIYTNRRDTFMEEQRWLYMIPDDQLGKRYYNLTKCFEHWSSDPVKYKTTCQRVGAKIREKRKNDPEYCERVRLKTIEARLKLKNENPEKWREIYKKLSVTLKDKFENDLVYRNQQLNSFTQYRERKDYKQHRKEIGQKLANDPKFKETMKIAMNRPEVIAKTRLSMLGKKQPQELIDGRKKTFDETHYQKMVNLIKDIQNPEEIYTRNKYRIGAVMKEIGLNRDQVKFMLKYHDIKIQKPEVNRQFGNISTTGSYWWNNGIEELVAKEAPDMNWNRGRIKKLNKKPYTLSDAARKERSLRMRLYNQKISS